MSEGRTGALRRFVDERMAAVGIASVVELADISDVGRDTLYAWFRGRPPTARAGGRVARSLGVSYRELLDAYEGKERGEAPEDLASAIREQSRAIGAQTVAINDLVNELRELALRAPSAGPTVDELEAQMRALRTEVRLHHSEPDGAARPARSAPLESER